MKTVIFDFDGTIADTRAGIVSTVKATLHAMGLPDVAEDAIKELIGLPLKETFVRAANIDDEKLLAEAVDTYRRLFNKICEDKICLFPHVADTLRELHSRGKILAVASSRGHESLSMLLGMFGISRYISLISGEQDVVNKKPAPDMALRILDITHSKASETLVVGDTSFDIEMGKGAGCTTCGVTYGNHPRQKLETAGADFIIDNFADITDIVN